MAFQPLSRNEDPDNGGVFLIEVDGPLFPGSTHAVDRYDFVRVSNSTSHSGAALVLDRDTREPVLPLPLTIKAGFPTTTYDLAALGFNANQRRRFVIDGQWPSE